MNLSPDASAGAEAALGSTIGKSLRGNACYEPSLSRQFLPRCAACGHKHPLAYMPPLDPAACPACGAPSVPPPAAVTVPAVLTGRSPPILLARALFAAGKFCRVLKKRLTP